MKRVIDRVVAGVVTALLVAACAGGEHEAETAAARAASPLDESAIVQEVARVADTGDATTLTAATVGATVTVPDAALVAVDAAALSAQVFALDDPASGVHGITFVLGPDGSRFAAPVLLEWDGPWAPGASFALRATAGDGTPITDDGSSTANSLAALRVTPTSGSTAHYVLPVDHFSSWSVWTFPIVWGFGFSGSVSVPDELLVGEPATAEISAEVSNVLERVCRSVAITGTGALEVTSTPTFGCDAAANHAIVATVRCREAGTGHVHGTIYAVDAQSIVGAPDERHVTEDAVRRQMLLSAFSLQHVGSDRVATEVFASDVTGLAGATYAWVFTAAVRCTTTVPSITTTTATSSSSTTTRPRVYTGLPDSPRPTTTPPPDDAPSTTGSRTTVAPTTTMPAPPTTVAPPPPSDTLIPPTTTYPPDAPWGAAGAWAFNETGSCDYNGLGSCGWYYTDVRGTYRLGPPGGPGDTIEL